MHLSGAKSKIDNFLIEDRELGNHCCKIYIDRIEIEVALVWNAKSGVYSRLLPCGGNIS